MQSFNSPRLLNIDVTYIENLSREKPFPARCSFISSLFAFYPCYSHKSDTYLQATIARSFTPVSLEGGEFHQFSTHARESIYDLPLESQAPTFRQSSKIARALAYVGTVDEVVLTIVPRLPFISQVKPRTTSGSAVHRCAGGEEEKTKGEKERSSARREARLSPVHARLHSSTLEVPTVCSYFRDVRERCGRTRIRRPRGRTTALNANESPKPLTGLPLLASADYPSTGALSENFDTLAQIPCSKLTA